MRFGIFLAPFHAAKGQNPVTGPARDVAIVKLLDELGMLAMHWDVVRDRAEQFGTVANRAGWRLVGPMHLAETREQAYADVEYGIDDWCDYLQHVAAVPHFEPSGATLRERIDWVNEAGVGVIGTPEDAVRQIRNLSDQSKGGFGA